MKYFLTLILLVSACGFTPVPHSENAKQYVKEKKYNEAISEYEKHIKERLEIKNRPDWENPYIYYLDIGDIYLEEKDPGNALKYYLLAKEHDVKPAYVSDRMRYLASWYEEQGDLKAAIIHLKKYRDLDPTIFDLMLDRIAKKLVKQEETK